MEANRSKRRGEGQVCDGYDLKKARIIPTYHCVLSKSRDVAGSEVSTFTSPSSGGVKIMIPQPWLCSDAQVPAAPPPRTCAAGAKLSEEACSFAEGGKYRQMAFQGTRRYGTAGIR
jgi:hypothetical protein